MSSTEFKKAVVWGAGLGVGFAITGFVLGLFKRI